MWTFGEELRPDLTGNLCKILFILYVLRFSLRNLLSQNPVHSCLQPIKSEKRQFHVQRKRFVQSRRTFQKYWLFAPSPLCPVSLRETQLRRWFCKHFEKGFGVLGGKGNKPNAAEAITDEEVSILYMKNLLGITSAEALLNTLQFMNSIHFAL